MTPKEVLVATRAKISDPNRWTREVAARDGHGIPCDPDQPEAACWCLVGAIVAVCPNDQAARNQAYVLLRAPTLNWELGIRNLHIFNDRNPHCVVLTKLDEAIAAIP